MSLAEVLSLAVSALKLGTDLVKLIKSKLAKKIIVTPNSIETHLSHWDSTRSVIIQNKTDKPMFSVQVAFWHGKDQTLGFKLETVKKEAQVKGIVINYGVVVFRGNIEDEKVAVIELLRLMPGESVEVDLEIKKPGSVKIFPVSYDDKQSKRVLNSSNDFAYPFNAPFNMKPTSISLFLRKSI